MAQRTKIDEGTVAVNGLQMHYDLEGDGPPLLLLHGGFTSTDHSFGKIRPGLNQRFTTIGLEQQAHGHTPDIERPLGFTQSADDTAAALTQLGFPRVDVVGFSDGGNVGLALALRHPDRVGKLAVLGTQFDNRGLTDETRTALEKGAAQPPAEAAAAMPARLREAYEKVAPRPEDWPRLVSKVYRQAVAFPGWPESALRQLRGPILVMVGDRDVVTVPHALRLHGLVPNGALAVLPATDHISVMTRPEWVTAMLLAFLTEAHTTEEHTP